MIILKTVPLTSPTIAPMYRAPASFTAPLLAACVDAEPVRPLTLVRDEAPLAPNGARDALGRSSHGRGSWLMRIGFLIAGLILSAGSSESAKEAKRGTREHTRTDEPTLLGITTTYHPECSVERPESLIEDARRLSNECQKKAGPQTSTTGRCRARSAMKTPPSTVSR